MLQPIHCIEAVSSRSKIRASLKGITFIDLFGGTEQNRFNHPLSSATNALPGGEPTGQEHVASTFYWDASDQKVAILILQ